MWHIEDLIDYLDDQHLNQIQTEQLQSCRLVCHLLNGDYELEIRNQVFGPNNKVHPVQAVKDGELVLISAKRHPSEAEYQETLTRAKSEAHLANMKKARSLNQKNYFDSRASKVFVDLLRTNGYLSPKSIAKRTMTVGDIKEALHTIVDNYLSRSYPNRDELTRRLVEKDPAFIFFVSKAAFANMDFCQKLLTTNPRLDLTRIDPSVRNDWEFINTLYQHQQSFTIPVNFFSPEIAQTLNEAGQFHVLRETIEYRLHKQRMETAQAKLTAKLEIAKFFKPSEPAPLALY
ncbi:hypothetical protein AWB71_06023 [Caballeronia peredens]|nr:hypothetical protein AWB71_06023 [Caballeronia peredens]